MRRCVYLLISALVWCAGCADEDVITIHGEDRCPEDPDKTKPGKCGCGVPDVDADGDGVMDCFAGDEDRCPDDPDKMVPGECGCGVPDVDADENGVMDCYESGAIDHCPTDPEKWEPGKCGCGVPDTASNIADSDGDGVLDCLDQCPDNPNKTVPGIYGCEDAPADLDSDGDGVPDHRDACPDNPEIAVEISDAYVDCHPLDVPVIAIKQASDFETLRETLVALERSPAEGQHCTSGNVCLDAETILECHEGIWRARGCASCVDGACSGPEAEWRKPMPVYVVRVMNDINLADGYETTTADSGCTTSQWQSIPRLNNVRFEAVNDAVVRFELEDGTRCALPQALIHESALAEFRHLTLDFDMTGAAQAALIDHADSSVLNQVVYQGKVSTQAAKDVGGLVGYATSVQPDLEMRFEQSYCDQAIIEAPKASNVGCIVGRMVDGMISTGDAVNEVASLTALENAGGLVGLITSLHKDSQLEQVQNRVTLMDCKQYCGGALGICEGSGRLTGVKNRLDVMNAKKGEYIGGFAGGIYLLDDDKSVVVSDVTSSSNVINAVGGYYSAGFVAYTAGQVVYQDIENQVTQLLGDFYTGGFSASAHHILASDIYNIVTELKAQNTLARPAFTGGFTGEAVGGRYTRIVSRVANLINESSTSGSVESEYQHSIGGFVASVSEQTTFEHISSWANIYANFITPAGFIGRLESGWTTEVSSQATFTDIVSLSRVYKFTDGSNVLGSATEGTKYLMAGKLEDYTAQRAYFYQRSGGTAFASQNGAFTGFTDSDKSDVLSSLQASWEGWRLQDITLGSETLLGMPSFE